MRKILMMTNHLFQWAGSELVVLELAEMFQSEGKSVVIFANDIDSKFISQNIPDGIYVTNKREEIKIHDFDLVYCQHQVLTLFLDQLLSLSESQVQPRIVYGHLSPYERLEFPGAAVEWYYADKVICNSFETYLKMVDFGLEESRMVVFPNPAPDDFFDVPLKSGKPKGLLAISNHFPKEVRTALRILERKGIRVTRRGNQYVNQRITPYDMAQHDIVLSIGKSVQYAIASRRPVYNYDQFGGPGWIDSKNLKNAEQFNFSGRCVGWRKSAEDIVAEILSRMEDIDEMSSFYSEVRNDFRLSIQAKKIFMSDEMSVARRQNFIINTDLKNIFKREGQCYEDRIIHRNRRRRNRLVKKVKGWISKKLVYR